MVNTIRINNFKSIKNVEFFCKKINIFIGEPNSGKSNIIEALSLLSQGVIGQQLSKEVLRYNSIADLFFDFNINRPVELFTNEFRYLLKYAIRENGVPENRFVLEVDKNPAGSNSGSKSSISIGHEGKVENAGTLLLTNVRYYQYKRLSSFQLGYLAHLAAPFGENLPSLLLSNEELRNWVSEFFESVKFTLTLKPSENEINMSKLINKSIYSYPYLSISETLQRIVFYIMAIKSNKNAVLLFDEPESNTFPFYTKFLAERIALDETNQFFITTHNPYLLLSLIEKSPLDKINVNLVTMSDSYETQIKTLSQEQIEEILDFDSDVFFNLGRIVD